MNCHAAISFYLPGEDALARAHFPADYFTKRKRDAQTSCMSCKRTRNFMFANIRKALLSHGKIPFLVIAFGLFFCATAREFSQGHCIALQF